MDVLQESFFCFIRLHTWKAYKYTYFFLILSCLIVTNGDSFKKKFCKSSVDVLIVHIGLN
jgi:hypothetical protein